MPTHAEQRHSPFSPDQLFDLVADVERYPEFLPWCVAARIRRRDGNTIWADSSSASRCSASASAAESPWIAPCIASTSPTPKDRFGI